MPFRDMRSDLIAEKEGDKSLPCPPQWSPSPFHPLTRSARQDIGQKVRMRCGRQILKAVQISEEGETKLEGPQLFQKDIARSLMCDMRRHNESCRNQGAATKAHSLSLMLPVAQVQTIQARSFKQYIVSVARLCSSFVSHPFDL